MSERVSDEQLADLALLYEDEAADMWQLCRELQQRRAADKYVAIGHMPSCKKRTSGGFDDYGGPIVRTPCTCGYDQLPEWLKHGKDA